MTTEKALSILINLKEVNEQCKSNRCLSDADKADVNDVVEAFEMAIEALQKPKQGRWIGGELGYCTCCGHEGCASDIWNGCETLYCPACGARILEEDE